MTLDLLDAVLQVRELSGRPLDDEGLRRMRDKISRLSDAEVTAERKILLRLLGSGLGTPVPADRDRP